VVEIRRLQPTVKLAIPKKVGRSNHNGPNQATLNAARRIVIRRRLIDFPAPTPQPTPCRLWQGYADKQGYGRRKVLLDNGKWRTIGTHRWVMEELLGRRLGPKEVILHACDNPPCFRIDHRSVGTLAENNADMKRKKRNKKPPPHVYHGEAHPMAKLTQAQVEEIKARRKERGADLAREFGVNRTTIYRVLNGIRWKEGK